MPKDIILVVCAELLARAYTKQGRQQEAVLLLSAADAMRRKTGFPILDSQIVELSACYDQLKAAVQDADFETAWNAGRVADFEVLLEQCLKEPAPN